MTALPIHAHRPVAELTVTPNVTQAEALLAALKACVAQKGGVR
jgi:hypothetical protein